MKNLELPWRQFLGENIPDVRAWDGVTIKNKRFSPYLDLAHMNFLERIGAWKKSCMLG